MANQESRPPIFVKQISTDFYDQTGFDRWLESRKVYSTAEASRPTIRCRRNHVPTT
jgi:hypothetical protein